jgi:ABC-type transporter Mla maintaining outer membrane lipid asymmetry ATPase subunit MlaF
VLTSPLLQVRGVNKAYGGLRPLRLADLAIATGETVALEGPDETAASVLVDLITGTTLPDAGEVLVAGAATAAIEDHEAWLAFLEQFGIVNQRVVLLDELTVLQNLAVPLTLDLDPLPEPARGRATAIAAVVGIDAASLPEPLATATSLTRFRVRLGRALAHDPRLLLVEHPTLGLAAADADACAAAIRAAVAAAGLAALVVTLDARLAGLVATRRLAWDAATGALKERSGGWRRRFRTG